MGEIVLPVRVMGYPDNDGTEHDSFYIQDADGRHWVWLVRRDDADEIAAALNDHSALQAQVAALVAERDRLWEQAATLRAEASRVAAGLLYDAMDLETAEDEKAARVRDAVRRVARLLRQKSGSLVTAIDRSRPIVGDGDEEVQS